MSRRIPAAPVGGRQAQSQLIQAALTHFVTPATPIVGWDALLAYLTRMGYVTPRWGKPFRSTSGLEDHIKAFGRPYPFTRCKSGRGLRHDGFTGPTIYATSHTVAAWIMVRSYSVL